MDKLKAYMAYRHKTVPACDGCLLVFAPTPGKAKQTFIKDWPLLDYIEFCEVRVVRRPQWDEWAEGEEPYSAITNNDLHPFAPAFYDDSEYE